MSANDDSMLLALPLELLTRITDRLHFESLLLLRLTCKAFDAATFDRFAQVFALSSCCIYYETRWLSLQKLLNGPARIRVAIKHIKITREPLENRHFSQVQLAPGPDFDNIQSAQMQFSTLRANRDGAYEPLFTDKQATASLIHRVFLDIALYAPNACIDIDLARNDFFRNEGIDPSENVLLALLSARCEIDSLKLSRHIAEDSPDVILHLKQHLLSCTSSVTLFHLTSTGGDPNPQVTAENQDADIPDFILDIVSNAADLRRLILDLNDYPHSGTSWTVVEKLLLATDLSNLISIDLQCVVVTETQLCGALTSFSSDLRTIYLGGIVLTQAVRSWSAVVTLLLRFTKLEVVTFWNLNHMMVGDDEVKFLVFADMECSCYLPKVRMESNENVHAIGVSFHGKQLVSDNLPKLLLHGRMLYET